MNIKHIIYGITGLPNRIYNALIMKYRHVKHGNNLRINGRIHCVSNTADGIVIGDDVSINSCLGVILLVETHGRFYLQKAKGRFELGTVVVSRTRHCLLVTR